MPAISPLALRQLHSVWTLACESDRAPADVSCIERNGRFELHYRNFFLGSFPAYPTVEQVRAILRAFLRGWLTDYLTEFSVLLSDRISLPGGWDVQFSLDHELLFFDEDASTTHLFLLSGDSPFQYSGEIRLHTHLAKASLSLAPGHDAPDCQPAQMLSGPDRFVFGDSVDELVDGICQRIQKTVCQAVDVVAPAVG
jgi:hypothetical protein